MGIISAIEDRKSIRKYSEERLPKKILDEIKDKIAEVNKQYNGLFRMQLLEGATKESKMGTVFGTVKINAPYTIVLIGKKGQSLVAGYEGEKLVLELTNLGIGTCWLGTFSKEGLSKLCYVTGEESIFCVISMGIPFEGGFLNTTMRKVIGSHKRKTIENIAFTKEEKPLTEMEWKAYPHYKEAIELAIKAPSANNVQPWRVVVSKKQMELCYKAPFELDAGIFLAHLVLVLEEKGLQTQWQKSSRKEEEGWIKAGVLCLSE